MTGCRIPLWCLLSGLESETAYGNDAHRLLLGLNFAMNHRATSEVARKHKTPQKTATGLSQAPRSSLTGPSVGPRVPSTKAGGRTEIP